MKYLFYIYGITQAETPLHKLESVTYKGVTAIFSKVDYSEFSQTALEANLKKPDWLRPKILAHEKILEAIMEKGPVIPMKFGCLFKSLERVKAVLKLNYEKLEATLENLKDKEEWAVKLYCDKSLLKKKFFGGNKKTKPLAVGVGGEGTQYLMEQKKDEALNAQFEEHLLKKAQDFHSSISSCVQESSINALPPKEFLLKKDWDIVLNAAYLVSKARKASFAQTLKTACQSVCGDGFAAEKTGPYPPYCFTQGSLEK